MGCYAAMNALKLARHIVRSEPQSKVAIVNLELCTLHLQETDNIEEVLSFLIFADGCSASIVSAEPDGIELRIFRTTVIPAAPIRSWHIGRNGFDMRLAGIPGTGSGLPDAMPSILNGRSVRDVELWAVHPGGRSILDAVEGAVGAARMTSAVPRSAARLRQYVVGHGHVRAEAHAGPVPGGRHRRQRLGLRWPSGDGGKHAVPAGLRMSGAAILSRRKLRSGTDGHRAGQLRGIPALPARSAPDQPLHVRIPSDADVAGRVVERTGRKSLHPGRGLRLRRHAAEDRPLGQGAGSRSS